MKSNPFAEKAKTKNNPFLQKKKANPFLVKKPAPANPWVTKPPSLDKQIEKAFAEYDRLYVDANKLFKKMSKVKESSQTHKNLLLQWHKTMDVADGKQNVCLMLLSQKRKTRRGY